MKNLKLRKILLAVCSAMLLVTLSVGATFAYLTSTTGTVTNTFTVGNVEITLDEAKVTLYGEVDGTTRVQENKYKLIPGHAYTKDPTVHVDADSESAWLFVKVENGIFEIEAANTTEAPTTTIAAQMTAKGWVAVDDATDVYAYNKTVSGGENITVFDSFTLTGEANVADYENAEVKITAYAVQADGFNTAEAAWEAAPTDWN